MKNIIIILILLSVSCITIDSSLNSSKFIYISKDGWVFYESHPPSHEYTLLKSDKNSRLFYATSDSKLLVEVDTSKMYTCENKFFLSEYISFCIKDTISMTVLLNRYDMKRVKKQQNNSVNIRIEFINKGYVMDYNEIIEDSVYANNYIANVFSSDKLITSVNFKTNDVPKIEDFAFSTYKYKNIIFLRGVLKYRIKLDDSEIYTFNEFVEAFI